MMYRTLQLKRARATWWVLGAILMTGLTWPTQAGGITVDGKITPYDEWSGANVVISDQNEPDLPDNYDVKHIMMDDGNNSLYVVVTVYGDKIGLAAAGADNPYLNFYFNLYSGGGPAHRFGLTYNDGYGLGSDKMHLIQYDNGWKDLGEVDFAIDEAVEVAIPWSTLPPELIAGPSIAVQNLFFLYNVAPGDANADGAVGVGDLGILASNYGTVGEAQWATGDFNLDACVGVGDLGILASHYGYQAPEGCLYDIFDENTKILNNDPLTKHTPEPLTVLAVGMGIAGLAGYIRKRKLA